MLIVAVTLAHRAPMSCSPGSGRSRGAAPSPRTIRPAISGPLLPHYRGHVPLSPILDLRCGGALEVLTELSDSSIDVVLSDPPYGLDFTRLLPGTRWDRDSAGFDSAVWSEVRRVVRTGA